MTLEIAPANVETRVAAGFAARAAAVTGRLAVGAPPHVVTLDPLFSVLPTGSVAGGLAVGASAAAAGAVVAVDSDSGEAGAGFTDDSSGGVGAASVGASATVPLARRTVFGRGG